MVPRTVETGPEVDQAFGVKLTPGLAQPNAAKSLPIDGDGTELALATVPVTPVASVAGTRVRPNIETILPSVDGEKLNLGAELRRSVFAEEGDEKVGWSVAAIMSFAFGVLAFILMLVAIVSMIGLGPLWFVPAIFGFIFGLAGLITGAIGLKQTRSGGRKGRGFAIAGLISGIIGMVVSLISLVVGFVRIVLN